MTDNIENPVLDRDHGRIGTMIVYALYGLSFLAAIPGIIGLIVAYVLRDDYSKTVYGSHMTWLIRTFWLGILYTFISFVTSFILIGMLFYVLTAIWFIIRVVVGAIKAWDGKPIENPTRWLV
jgi:uncharacterized membrane protein